MFVGIGMNLVRGGTSASPASLFAAAEPGAWYDPSDLTTVFQDSAGTTPVTTPGQTVGLMLDKSKNGIGANGAFCRNLLTYTEQFEINWGATELTVSADVATAPNGTTTADSLVASVNSVSGRQINRAVTNLTVSNTYTFSVYAKAFGYNWIRLGWGSAFCFYDVSTGVVGTAGTATGQIEAVGNGWYRCIFISTAPTTTINPAVYMQTANNQFSAWAGNGTSGVYVWGAQLELGSSATSYQPITSSWSATIPGNHATQATLTQRPIYGINPIVGTRNLLTYTEQFDNAAWGKITFGTGVTPVVTYGFTDPDGGNTAWRLQLNAGTNGASDYSLIRQSNPAWPDTGTRSIWLRSNTGSNQTVALIATNSNSQVTVTPAWQRFGNAITGAKQLDVSVGGSGATGATADVLIWHPQLEASTVATAYQKVVSQYEVTEAGVQSASYLAFDGVDDCMVTGTITPPSLTTAQVFVGIRKLTNTASGIVVELSNTIGNFGTFGVYTENDLSLGLNGQGTTFQSLTPYSAPITVVLSAMFDTAGAANATEIFPRVNGVIPTITVLGGASTATGNFLAYPLYLGRRGGTSLPYNGRIYSLITRFGANLTTGQITSTESWVNAKTGAY